MKSVGIIQSNYLPWRGYFDFIQDVDTFIFLDDAQYTRRDWRNRNRIKTKDGLAWLTVPVKDEFGVSKIYETTVRYTSDWANGHLDLLRESYRRAPYFELVYSQLDALLARKYETISELNQQLCKWVLDFLGIETEIRCATEFSCEGAKSEKLLNLVKCVGGDCYLSGPAAKDYLDIDLMREKSVDVFWKRYRYPEYKQQWGAFEGGVSVVDLLFNEGEGAVKYLKSQEQWERA